MASFNPLDILAASGSSASSQGPALGVPVQGRFNPAEFLRQKQNLDSILQSYDGFVSSRQNDPFSVSGGTEGLYNSWKNANALDSLAIEAERGSKWWNQLQSHVAGLFGGDEARADWTFDPNKFNLFNGLDSDDVSQARNFVFSLPGMMVGGILEGAGDLYEGISGRPINEYRETEDGSWEIPDYELDMSQRAGDFVDAGINHRFTYHTGAKGGGGVSDEFSIPGV